MDIDTDVVPVTVDEALRMLREGIKDADRDIMRRTPHPGDFHFSVGTWLRDNWSLWDERSHLRGAFRVIGLSHPVDISGYLIERLWVEARGGTFDSAAFVARVQDHWITEIGTPIP
jgi:hypothetical protein